MSIAKWTKLAKIIVDVLMLIFVILSLVRWDGDPTFHIVVGSIFSALFIVHFLLNIKTFASMTKKFGKLKVKIKLQYSVDIVLVVIWSVAVIVGIIATFYYLNSESSINEIGRLHGMLGRIGCGFILTHIVQHIKQIRSYFVLRKGTSELLFM